MDRIIQGSEAEFLSLIEKAVRNVLKDYVPVDNNASKAPADKKEAASYLNISITTLDQLLKSAQLPSFKIGRQVRIRWSDLESYVNQKGTGS